MSAIWRWKRALGENRKPWLFLSTRGICRHGSEKTWTTDGPVLMQTWGTKLGLKIVHESFFKKCWSGNTDIISGGWASMGQFTVINEVLILRLIHPLIWTLREETSVLDLQMDPHLTDCCGHGRFILCLAPGGLVAVSTVQLGVTSLHSVRVVWW